jgi:two-component system, NtrC family, response regulator AtoC
MQSSIFGIRSLAEDSVPERLVFGRSAAMQEVREAVERVADVSVPVLLQGERGTGKEIIAKEIHRRSRWGQGPFVRVSRTELTATASRPHGRRSERERGTFPWRMAKGPTEGCAGTLFFDEVSELSHSLQATLLSLFRMDHSSRANEESSIRAGSRIICATKRDLQSVVAAGHFRSDLFYRINIVAIQLPRLHDRREDIPDLVEYFSEVQCQRQSRICPPVPIDVVHLFCEYQWPGNIRELENCIRRYVQTNGEAAIRPPSAMRTDPQAKRGQNGWESIPLKAYRRQVLQEAETDMILSVLRKQRWNRKEAARVLQISYNTLLHKLKQSGLDKKHAEKEVNILASER